VVYSRWGISEAKKDNQYAKITFADALIISLSSSLYLSFFHTAQKTCRFVSFSLFFYLFPFSCLPGFPKQQIRLTSRTSRSSDLASIVWRREASRPAGNISSAARILPEFHPRLSPSEHMHATILPCIVLCSGGHLIETNARG